MAKTSRDLLAQARTVVSEVTVDDVQRDLAGAEPRYLLDVRDRDEFEQGYIPGARHLSKGNLEMNIEARVPDRSTPITLYCAAGNRSLLAGRSLVQMGYEDVVSMSG
ncbi:MAG TPA: rhodanese-like domain-containing protein, partial [Candidatus Dormibacteraeota bacterium]|nr:rhodanese-like domain-containing protein [Candidatus Dormibacteraeota bacterium]